MVESKEEELERLEAELNCIEKQLNCIERWMNTFHHIKVCDECMEKFKEIVEHCKSGETSVYVEEKKE